MADMNGHDAIVRVYNQFANARHHMVGLPWSYTCVPASVQAVQVSFARKDGKRATEKKKSLSSIWFVWKWFKWWDLHQCIRLIRKLVFSIIKFVGAIFSHTNTHPSFSAGWLYIRFFGTGRKKGMNKNTGYTQWVWLPGYGVLGFWS